MTAIRWIRGDFSPWADTPQQNDPRLFNPPSKDQGPVAHLVIDAPSPVNALSQKLLEQLETAIREIQQLSGVSALIAWSAKTEHFVAGADIDEIAAVQSAEKASEMAAKAQAIFQMVADLPIPTVAMIDGTCLGGGLELALAFDYRVATDRPQCKLGLPEVNLGLFPGFGGTQRLPRLIGLRAGLGLILAASRLPAKAALRRGIVDAVTPYNAGPSSMLTAAQRLLTQPHAVARSRRKRRGGILSLLLERNPLGRSLLLRGAKKQVLAKTGGHYPAPMAAIEVIIRGYGENLASGLEREAKAVGPLIVSDTCKNLIEIYRSSEKVRKLDGLPPSTSKPTEKPSLGILGAGVMGAGIAALALDQGLEVRLRDLQQDALTRAYEQIGAQLYAKVKRGRRSALEHENIISRLECTIGLYGFAKLDGVIEAVVENLAVKKTVLAELENCLPTDAIIASNTSALSITELQLNAKHPERVVGMHFFNPVEKMPLVEVIPGKQSSESVAAQVAKWAVDMGKYPIVVQDSPGFLVNRLLVPYLDSACRLLQKGIPGPHIDATAKKFGLPMGPFRLLDEIGIDIGIEVAQTLYSAFGARLQPCEVLDILASEKLIGKKAGLGFYHYSAAQTHWNNALNTHLPASSLCLTDAELIHYLLDPLIDEAARCLQEKLVESPHIVDLAMVMGTGFPPFLGGPLRYASKLGLAAVVERLSQRHRDGEQREPCEHLLQLTDSGRCFYPNKY